MGRMTLRLPETLHKALLHHANAEGVSLNQYVVYALTRQTTPAYTVNVVPKKTVEEQREAYLALRDSLGNADPDAVNNVLSRRKLVRLERDVDVLAAKSLQRRMTTRTNPQPKRGRTSAG